MRVFSFIFFALSASPGMVEAQEASTEWFERLPWAAEFERELNPSGRSFEDHMQMAMRGNANSQLFVAHSLSSGRGVERNDVEATRWFRIAAEQGNVDAQHQLGTRYFFGSGTPRDFVAAVEWYRRAAAQGNAYSQQELARAYANGDGVPQDFVLAFMWANIAAARDVDDYNLRQRLSEFLTPSQLAQAQEMSTRCFESGYQNCRR